MIKVGVRAHDYGKETPEDLFTKIRGDGFSCVQLAPQKAIKGVDHMEDIPSETVNRITAAAHARQISIAVFGVYVDLVLPDEELRRKNTAIFKNSFTTAKALSAHCVGTETTNRSLQGGMTEKESFNTLLCSLWEVMPAAEQDGLTVAVEPVYYHTLNTPEKARELLKIIASPNLKIIFDPVNLLAPEEITEQERLWERCFACFGDHIAAVHIKGIAIDEQSRLFRTDLSHSIVHYPSVFSALKQLPQSFSVLREEANPETAHLDCAMLKSMLL